MLYSYLINALIFISLLLRLLVIRYLLKGSFRKYPILLAYCVAEVVTTIAEVLVSDYAPHQWFIRLYYSDEVGIDLLLFLMVTTLTYRALEGNPMRGGAGRVLGLITVGVVTVPFIIFYPSIHDFAWFFNNYSNVLNFGAAIMNLVLWTALIGATKRDAQLLTVSAGLGIQVTAQAIGFSVRHFLPPHQRWLPDLFMTMASLPAAYLWWRAFKPPATAATPVVRSTEIHPGEV
jgi:hypothetical protein